MEEASRPTSTLFFDLSAVEATERLISSTATSLAPPSLLVVLAPALRPGRPLIAPPQQHPHRVLLWAGAAVPGTTGPA